MAERRKAAKAKQKSENERKQRNRDLAKTTAALNIADLSIEEAGAGATLAADAMGEDISTAHNNSNSPLPRATAAIFV